MAETAEEISQRPEIRKELQRATGEKRPETVRARGRDKFWFIIQAVVLLGCVAVYFSSAPSLFRSRRQAPVWSREFYAAQR